MAIEATYRQILINEFIKRQLQQGTLVSAQDLEDQISAALDSLDLSAPQFKAENFYVTEKTSSSASLMVNTLTGMREDLRALYKNMILLSKVSIEAVERWEVDAVNIEKKLIDLEERIENLLLLTQETDGYNAIFVDNLTDTAWTDLTLSTTENDLKGGQVTMSPTPGSESRVFLNNLEILKDVDFRVRTSVDFLARVDAVTSELTDMFHQESKTWWTNVQMRKQKPTTCELTVRLSPDGPVSISKIFLALHDSAESSPMNITPLYSVDNRTYQQLPTNTFTLEARTTATFSFQAVQAQWVKFILTKRGPDPSSGLEFFNYQFGFKEIAFFDEGFSANTRQQFISRPISIIGQDRAPLEFERLTLETCERVEDGTKINYFITTSNDPTVPINPDTGEPTAGVWIPISPVQRTVQPYPVILSVGDTTEVTVGDDETVTISYDGRSSDASFVNPGRTFRLLSLNSTTGAVEDTEVDPTKQSTISRYGFVNTNERILNYQIKDSDQGDPGTALIFDPNSLSIFRNVGEQGITPGDADKQVRDVQIGWKFEDPYYSCVIEITNPEGLEIDVGDSPIIIDDVTYTNKIDATVLTGKSGIIGDRNRESGLHTIRVHKNNWAEVTPDLNTLSELSTADPLYPFNHKLLIEGYAYGTSYPDTSEKIYTGADLFAESRLTRVSIFDLINNIVADNYDVFAVDRDTPNSHYPSNTNEPTQVFVVKVDEENPDFQNERFVIRFRLVNERRTHVRLRADFTTENEAITPSLDSYKIKFG